MNGIRVLTKEPPKSSLVPSAMGDTARDKLFMNQEGGSPPDTISISNLIFVFPAS